MKLSLLVLLSLALAFESAASFGTLPQLHPVTRPSLASPLRYTIIAPPDDDDDKKSKEQQPPVQQQQQQAVTTDNQGGPGSLEGYHDYNELEDEDLLNVDSYDNQAGGIMPGFHLSSLCSDD